MQYDKTLEKLPPVIETFCVQVLGVSTDFSTVETLFSCAGISWTKRRNKLSFKSLRTCSCFKYKFDKTNFFPRSTPLEWGPVTSATSDKLDFL